MERKRYKEKFRVRSYKGKFESLKASVTSYELADEDEIYTIHCPLCGKKSVFVPAATEKVLLKPYQEKPH